MAGPLRNCQSSVWRGKVATGAPVLTSHAPTRCWKVGFLPGAPSWSAASSGLSPPVTASSEVAVPSSPTAVWVTPQRKSSAELPPPVVVVCSVVTDPPPELYVCTGWTAGSSPPRNTPSTICRPAPPPGVGNSAGEEMTPVATVGTPDADTEPGLIGQPGSSAPVAPLSA